MGYGAFAGERERGTLRQIMTAGAGHDAVFAGKLRRARRHRRRHRIRRHRGLDGGSSASSSDGAARCDTIVRGASLFVGFAAYACACAGVALLVSARARTATSALLILLTIWAVSIVVVPRVAASAGELLHPTPDGSSVLDAGRGCNAREQAEARQRCAAPSSNSR